MTKTCTKCGKELPATNEHFGKCSRNQSGFRAECKACQAQQNKVWYSENRETILIVHAGRRDANREYMRRKSKQWYYDNKERAKATSKAWRQRNKEHCLGIAQKYRERSRSLRSLYAQKRIARIRSLPATLTSVQWELIKAVFGNSCAYCGESAPLEQEHIVPVTRGGGYTPENIIPACTSCNCSKGNKRFEDWYPKQKFYSADREAAILRTVGRNAIQQRESA